MFMKDKLSLSKLNSKESIYLNLVGVSTDKHLLLIRPKDLD